MKTLTTGHKYELGNFENPRAPGQVIQFIEKVPTPAADGTLQTVNDGTTNEEVITMLLDRLNILQAKFPCQENTLAIIHIETGLMWLNRRTEKRKARGVEGKHLK